MTSEIRDLLALHLVPGLGPRLTAALLERFGSAAEVLRASSNQLSEVPHIGAVLADKLHQAMKTLNLAEEEELIAKYGVEILAHRHPGYPEPLANIPDPPPILYIRGKLEPEDVKGVGLVGSRQCTSYGKRVAERLAGGLARKGYTVISGLARGIDGAAHWGALKAGGRTLAIMAGGLSRIYPPEHGELAAEVQSHGAMISEAPMAMEPLATMFPGRNRVISGLSRGVVIVEANERSGALITARHAAEQGRPVFAVPGPVDSAASAGTLQLLRQGAILVRHVDDILEELEGVKPKDSAPAPTKPAPQLDETQQKVWTYLAEQARHMDEITRHLGKPISEVAGLMMNLEMKKVVRRLPGNSYERC